MVLLYIVIGLFAIGASAVLFDMARFGRAKAKAENPTAAQVDAGGIIYVQGTKTYYKLPKGEIRKIADYAMDLRAGSVDMNTFTHLLDKARAEHEAEVKATKEDAFRKMGDVAKEEARAK